MNNIVIEHDETISSIPRQTQLDMSQLCHIYPKY